MHAGMSARARASEWTRRSAVPPPENCHTCHGHAGQRRTPRRRADRAAPGPPAQLSSVHLRLVSCQLATTARTYSAQGPRFLSTGWWLASQLDVARAGWYGYYIRRIRHCQRSQPTGSVAPPAFRHTRAKGGVHMNLVIDSVSSPSIERVLHFFTAPVGRPYVA